jgi:superfamily II DNA or RNA helicase
MYYPWYQDPDFNRKIGTKKEIVSKFTDEFLSSYQHVVSNYINPMSPYNSILLYFSTGTGKTIASIAIAENFIRENPSKKIVVVTKNQTLISDFKSQLDLLNKNSTRNYSFITYNSLKNKTVDFTDKVIIIDEIHNLLGNTGYEHVMSCVKISKRYKLVLLSATPAYDSITDLFQLSNILNGGVLRQYDIKRLHADGYVENIEIEKKYLYKNKILNLTEDGKKSLLGRLHGKISYLRPDIKDFPSVSFPNSKKIINGMRVSLGVIPCKMNPHQNDRYLKVVNNVVDINLIEGSLEMLSSMIYPDVGGKNVYGKSGMEYYIKERRNTDFLKENNIKNYSSKLYNMLLNLKNSKGKIYIHARNIQDDGVPLIKACLRANGYDKIIEVTSDSTPEVITKKISKFNSRDNDSGEKYKILIGSGIISEGITLKNIRQVHIYEPSWNYSSIDQIIGRTARRGSHSRLQKKDRTVDVYLYCALSTNIEKSVDFARYFLSSVKDRVLKDFERLIAVDSFTCQAFKKQNIRDSVDGSRECEYNLCNYTCNYEGTGSQDISTFNTFYHDISLYNKISSKILKVFEKTGSISIVDLAQKTNETQKDILDVMGTRPPIDVDFKFGIYSLKKLSQKDKFKKINREVESKEEVSFHKEGEKFLIELRLGSKSNKKSCLTGYDLGKLKDIFVKSGLSLPSGKITKKILCEILETKFTRNR